MHNTVYQVLWPSDRIVDCIHIDCIQAINYWYNALDNSNFEYSSKMECNFVNNKQKYAKLSIP